MYVHICDPHPIPSIFSNWLQGLHSIVFYSPIMYPCRLKRVQFLYKIFIVEHVVGYIHWVSRVAYRNIADQVMYVSISVFASPRLIRICAVLQCDIWSKIYHSYSWTIRTIVLFITGIHLCISYPSFTYLSVSWKPSRIHHYENLQPVWTSKLYCNMPSIFLPYKISFLGW